MTNSLKRKLAFYFFIFILALMLVNIVTCVATAQSPIGIENLILHIPEQTDLEKAREAKPISIKGHFKSVEPTVPEFQTVQYDSNQYVRVNEFQELKQKLYDQKEAYRRELMALVLARFCTFMSVEKAALEAVKYADGLIKELEK